MKKPSKSPEMLSRLAYALVEDILSATDEEVLKEAAEIYDDPTEEVKKATAIFQKARTAAGKKRLVAAQAAVRSENQSGAKILHMDGPTARRKLNTILRDHPEAGAEFTLAARKEQELSDDDVKGMLDDLRELGIYNPEDESE